MSIPLSSAATIVDAALARGRELGLAPLTVVVLDAGGHVVALKREDGSGILRVEIATGKAYGALGIGAGSRVLAKRAEVAPTFVDALAAASGGRTIPVAGGVLVRQGGRVIGAVGVSGDLSDNDEAAALAGIAAAELEGDTGA